MKADFVDSALVKRYVEKGPPAFAPGHAGMLQMTGVLLEERVSEAGTILVVGAGGGLEIRYLAEIAPAWCFVGVDPAAAMLDLARVTAGPAVVDRLHLIQGTVADAPPGPFDAATCILVLGLVADGGEKAALLEEVHRRLKPEAPFVLVDQCIDSSAHDFGLRLDRYAAYARRSGVDAETVAGARKAVAAMTTMATASRNEHLLRGAGFKGIEVFYVGMAWRGWIAYA